MATCYLINSPGLKNKINYGVDLGVDSMGVVNTLNHMAYN